MDLIEYSTAIKEIIRDHPSVGTSNFIKNLPEGITKQVFGFILTDKTIKVLSPFRSLPTIFTMVNRAEPQMDYDLSIRITAEGKTKMVSKRFRAEEDVDEAKNLLLQNGFERIYYEIITTEDFEITYSEFEGTVIKAKDAEKARKYFQILLGLFPFVDIEKDTKQIKVECEFNIREWDAFKKKQTHRGDLKCSIEVDGKILGTKGNSFVF